MSYKASEHGFVVCAYKENPHLEETIISLEKQTVQGNIYLSTSTPNEYIKSICEKHNITMFVNPAPVNLGSDWNYAYNSVPCNLVTLAHQDDIYEPEFLEETLKAINKSKNFILCFTDYYEIKKGKKEITNTLLRIKRLMNLPLTIRKLQSSKFIRRRTLSFGCPICCPSVTLNKKRLGQSVYNTTYVNSCDYKTWSDLSKLDGEFVYVNKPLMAHRIYAESTTTKNLSENIRKKEDFEILKGYWPSFLAGLINKVYSQSEKSNKV